MAIYCIQNDQLSVKVKSFGGELTSIIDNETGIEYLWCGDSKYWGRQAPILFPFVGSMKNKEFLLNGNHYSMGQHGFARDMEFECVQEESSIWCTLRSDEETKKKYPFDFKLTLGYILEERSIKVVWLVDNTGNQDLPFSIGGHPAFNCPIKGGKQTDYYIRTNVTNEIRFGEITNEGLLKGDVVNILEVEPDGSFPISEHLFDKDALVIENNQINTLELLTPDKVPYVTMKFDMPLCGIWSPTGKQAPFVCLEPWCGRCDANDFEGDIYSRDYGTILDMNESFRQEYIITFGKIK